MKWTVDRIENDIAVIEISPKQFVDIPVSALPSGVKEGDVVIVNLDENENENRKKNISKLMNELFVD